MTNISVFGKPRAFESYDFVFGGESYLSVENIHREPILKPKEYEDPVLHYFVRDDITGLECYKRVRGYEADRVGIVFGVAIKSATDINLAAALSDILLPFSTDFADALLDKSNRFKEPSIIDSLKETKWSQQEIESIERTTIDKPLTTPKKEMLLLVIPDLGIISSVEHIIKEYADVYMANNVQIFRDPINDIVLKQTGGMIYTIEDGELKPYDESSRPIDVPITGAPEPKAKKPFINWPRRSERPEMNKEGQYPFQEKDPIVPKKWKWLLVGLLVLVLGAIFLINRSAGSVIGNQTNEGADTGDVGEDVEVVTETPTEEVREEEISEDNTDVQGVTVRMKPYPQKIKNSWVLSPEIEQSASTAFVSRDIEFVVSDPSLVNVDDTYRMNVVKRPSKDTEIVVTAFINGDEVGRQTYTIAKAPKADTENTGESKKQIPKWNGKPRTMDDYLSDLERGLDQGKISPQTVSGICQEIINGEYGPEYKMYNKAVKLRKKANKKEKGNQRTSNI